MSSMVRIEFHQDEATDYLNMFRRFERAIYYANERVKKDKKMRASERAMTLAENGRSMAMLRELITQTLLGMPVE